jgi:serine/threonine protein phosphatase PrpC
LTTFGKKGFMSTDQTVTEWRVICETVPGASHLRAGIPNQDAILQLRESSRSLPIILSLSDGHGSDKCFRSNLGSRFAVKKAAQVIGEFLDARRSAFDLAEIEKEGREFLGKEFLRKWRKAVEDDLKKKPFTQAEFDKLKEKDGEKAVKLVEDNPLLAYGATSLTIAVEESFLLYLQLGDGQILTVSEKGEVAKPLPEDERLFANETTSLCSTKAENDFRFFVQNVTPENRPALILMSTDGYVNSFSEEAGFLKAATDFYEMLGSEGHDFINENLKAWLEEATKMGSGDDTTVGIIYRPNALKKPEIAVESETVSAESVSTDPNTGEKTVEIPEALLPSLTENQPEDPDDVTVTITIKKDKSKTSGKPVVTVKKNEQEKVQSADNSENTKTK